MQMTQDREEFATSKPGSHPLRRTFRSFRGMPLGGALALAVAVAWGAEPAQPHLLYRDDFENGADHWQPTDPAAWKIVDGSQGKVYSLFRASKYEPPFRSPLNISLLREIVVGDFTLEAKVKSTARDYGHRDMCVVFGYQGPSRFYYVHFGQKTDDHANQVFIVNDAARAKISSETTPGTPWDDKWHQVRIVRRVDEGTIEVFFDDLERPVMKGADKTFTWGQIGLGSFDDTGQWDDVKLYGVRTMPAN